jgi:hypothetical protein
MVDSQAPSLEGLPDQVDELLCAPSDVHRQIFLRSPGLVWIDARDDAAEAVRRFAPYFEPGELRVSGEETISIRFRGRRATVTRWHDPSDRHRALLALRRALAPDFEARIVADSMSPATLAFAVLPSTVWRELAQFHAHSVDERFHPLHESRDAWEVASGYALCGVRVTVIRS